MIIMPLGARCFVEEITPIDEVSARAAAAGLHAVILDENVPKPTEGLVIAVGTDPLIQELVHVGDTVTFGKYAGSYQMVEGRTYRNLELRELTAVIRPTPTTPSPLPSPSQP
jgi:co-chaperonin GroES (HSP10)